jgi:excisionase family DNA binding protein
MINPTGEKLNLDLITIDEATAAMKISRVQLWKLRRDGRIPYILIGKKAVFRRRDIDRFIRENLHPAKEAS